MAVRPLHIGGEQVVADRSYDDLDPWSGEVWATVSAAGRTETERAIDAAAAAFPGWAATSPLQKQAIFLAAARILQKRFAEVVDALVHETGAAQGFAQFQVAGSVAQVMAAAGWPALPVGQVLPSIDPARTVMTVRRPLGVVAGLTPWNGAQVLAWRTVLTPLAFGNTVVLKPSEYAPVSAGLLVAEILAEAGLPPGVLNVVTNAPGEIGPVADAIFAADAVRLLMFTGSAPTARVLASRAGAALKRTVLELGGYNPLLVLDDVDLDVAVDSAVFSAFYHQGQICLNARKVLVPATIADAFRDRFVARTEALVCGDPADPATFVGPLIHDGASDAVERQVAAAVAAGGRVLTGGTRDGRLFRPTVLADVPAGAAAHREETFGPVVLLQEYADVDEAVRVANATAYGLTASVLAGDQDRGLAVGRRIDAGMVQVNDPTISGGEPDLPNGGTKDSGWGYTGPVGMHDFTEIRQTSFRGAISPTPLPPA